MLEAWGDRERLEHVFQQTRVVRKPLRGIIAGYHVLPYVLVGLGADQDVGEYVVAGDDAPERLPHHAGLLEHVLQPLPITPRLEHGSGLRKGWSGFAGH